MATIDLSNVKFPITSLTKAQYAALTPKNPAYLYVITDATGSETTIYFGERALATTQSPIGVLVENVTQEVTGGGDVNLTIHYSDETTEVLTLFNQANVVSNVALDGDTNELVVTKMNAAASRIDISPIVAAAIGNPVVDVAFNSSTYVLTFTYKDDTTTVVDLPLESVFSAVAYDDETHKLTFTLVSGSTTVIDLTDLVPVTVSVIDDTTDAAAIPTAQAVVDFVAGALKIGTVE